MEHSEINNPNAGRSQRDVVSVSEQFYGTDLVVKPSKRAVYSKKYFQDFKLLLRSLGRPSLLYTATSVLQ
jgi:hypothetical protein